MKLGNLNHPVPFKSRGGRIGVAKKLADKPKKRRRWINRVRVLEHGGGTTRGTNRHTQMKKASDMGVKVGAASSVRPAVVVSSTRAKRMEGRSFPAAKCSVLREGVIATSTLQSTHGSAS